MNRDSSPSQTEIEYRQVISYCKALFDKKNKDYGTSWRILRLSSLTDQIFIKAQRIRSIQEKGSQKIADGIEGEFIGIINYCIIALIQKSLETLTKNRTTIVIAHRLSTIKRANQILVIENGEIAEQGDHTTLIEKQGRYYDLYTYQAKI